ncbi:MAG: 2-dehydropantoate 2-reductase [Candidatus Aminicenantes bacterium]|nr:2-dehydropantoate 2-reductase [Candidatus Aminicenantes bacterium]
MKEERNKPRLVILGGGAVGSVIAAALATKPGLEPLLVGRGEHVRAIRASGLRVDGLIDVPIRLDATEAIDFPLDDTLLMVTVKAVDLDAALRRIAPWLRPTTALLLLQNGLGIRELALKTLAGSPVPPDQVFIGIVAIGATFIGPGQVRCFGGNIRLEPAFTATPWFDRLHGLKPRFEASRDIVRDQWTKLLVNAVINPLSVILQGHNRLVAEERFDALKDPILAEGVAVAAAEGVELTIDAAFINRFVSSDNITSMLQDFRRNKPTEIDFINGAIVERGRKHGIAAPVNAFVVALIKALAARQAEQKT